MDDVFAAAAARWESIIIKDVLDVTNGTDWTYGVVKTTYANKPNVNLTWFQPVDDVSQGLTGVAQGLTRV